MIEAHPLTWPEGQPRTEHWQRITGRFNKKERRGTNNYKSSVEITINDGLQRVRAQLETIGISSDDYVISTNLPLRLDGSPKSSAKNPDDPGVSVWWRHKKAPPRVMAIDLYDRVADNLAAIAAVLDAMRSIERHGGKVIHDKAFTGFAALPSPEAIADLHWKQVLELKDGISPDWADIEAAYKRLASKNHPDKGGDAAQFRAITEAYAAAKKAYGK